MTRLLILLLFAVLIAGCDRNQSHVRVRMEPEQLHTTDKCVVRVVTIDGCQYIIAQTGWADGGMSIIHKQNCRYCRKEAAK
jgi:hypothetical protein